MSDQVPIRKRSEMRAAARHPDAPKSVPPSQPARLPPSDEKRVFTGTDCSVCGRPQFRSDGGDTCAAGHGGAEGVPMRIAGKVSSEIAEASHRLKEAIREAEFPHARDLDIENADVTNFTRRGREVPVGPAFGRIVEKQFVEDIEATYDRLEKALRLAEERGERGHLETALDEAETNARLAFRLLVTFKVEKRRWELENATVWAAARAEAHQVLEAEKASGDRKKQITDQDIEDYAARMQSDEYKAKNLRVYKMEQTVKSIEHLADVWLLRVKTLQSLYGRQR